jgi:hypothetical protein
MDELAQGRKMVNPYCGPAAARRAAMRSRACIAARRNHASSAEGSPPI